MRCIARGQEFKKIRRSLTVFLKQDFVGYSFPDWKPMELAQDGLYMFRFSGEGNYPGSRILEVLEFWMLLQEDRQGCPYSCPTSNWWSHRPIARIQVSTKLPNSTNCIMHIDKCFLRGLPSWSFHQTPRPRKKWMYRHRFRWYQECF